MFEGTITPLITPFKGESGISPEVDYDALEALIEWQLSCGVNGISACATTGESVTLSSDEQAKVLKRTIEVVKGRVPVIAGTGTNSTKDTIEKTRRARELGADGALVVVPYYNKPTQEGLVAHFSAVAKEGGLPVVLYSVPSRTVIEISIETYRALRKVPGIVATKESTDSVTRLITFMDAVGDSIALLAGDDTIVYYVMTLGGKGVISASANVIPKEFVAITDSARSGDMKASQAAQEAVLPIVQVMFSEPNPIPAKAALKILGKIPSDAVRLPLLPAKDHTKAKLREVLNIK